MKIGILETGEVHPDLKARHGDYPTMFEKLLGAVDPGLEFATVRVVAGEMPATPGQADAWLVTGSRHGVYDGLPWIEPLKAFLRDCVAARVPVVGICFGHQILAEALGGRAKKSDKGWALGVQDYELTARPGWMDGLPRRFAVRALHQDQVVELPPGATVLAPLAALRVRGAGLRRSRGAGRGVAAAASGVRPGVHGRAAGAPGRHGVPGGGGRRGAGLAGASGGERGLGADDRRPICAAVAATARRRLRASVPAISRREPERGQRRPRPRLIATSGCSRAWISAAGSAARRMRKPCAMHQPRPPRPPMVSTRPRSDELLQGDRPWLRGTQR